MISFAEKVWRAVQNIRKGKVKTYKEIAKIIGKPRAYRAVGNVLNKNSHAPKVPCHRVVRSDSSLGGYAGGVKKKIKFLEKEGIEIEKRKIDLKKFGFRF